MVRVLLWLLFLGFVGVNAVSVAGAYYTNSRIQRSFDSLTAHEASANEFEARAKLDALLRLQYLDREHMPDGFYDALSIKATGQMLEVSSQYVVTIWPLGRVKAVDADGTYDPDRLRGLDWLRDRLRIELEFAPYSISSSRRS